MAKFRYLAVDDAGIRKRGVIEAQNFQAAAEELRSQGLWIMKLLNQSRGILHRDLSSLTAPRVKPSEFVVFCRQLATLYKSGVGLLEGVRALTEQTTSKTFRKVLREMGDDMQQGLQLSAAAGKFPSIFTSVFIHMVRAGEVSGKLDEMLERLAVFYEKEHNTKAKVKSAMIYPAVMGVMTVVVVTLMMLFLIPQYVKTFQEMGIELPLPTRIVMMSSEFIQQHWYLVPLIGFAIPLLMRMIRSTPQGSYALDYLNLRIPVFGLLKRKQAIARFCRTFSSLHAAAIPMMQNLSIVGNVAGNEVFRKMVLGTRTLVRDGRPLAEGFRNSWLIPPMAVHMMAVGEKTGALDSMLEKAADFYEAELEHMSDRLKALLEPLMILVMAGVVGGIVAAMMMPMFTILENAQNM
jgi:type IV pilus assembly protein PilC